MEMGTTVFVHLSWCRVTRMVVAVTNWKASLTTDPFSVFFSRFIATASTSWAATVRRKALRLEFDAISSCQLLWCSHRTKLVTSSHRRSFSCC